MNSLLLLPLLAIDLLGPGARPATRQQINDRPDGTGNLIEYALSPSRFGSGFSTLRTFTTRREAGVATRLLLNEREVQLPPENLRVARLPYQFAVTQAQPRENRIAFLSGPTDSFVRTFIPANALVGRPIALPPNARLIGLRPNSDEIWVAHAGASSQVTVISQREERVLSNFQLRLNPQVQVVYMAFSLDGRLAWIVTRFPESQSERGSVLVIDCNARQIINSVNLGTSVPGAAVLSPDATQILIYGSSLNDSASAEASVLAFDTTTNTATVLTLGIANLSANPPAELFMHPDGTRMFYLQPQTSTIEVYELGARRVTRRVTLPRTSIAATMDLSPTGDFALVRDTNGTFSHLIDLENGELVDSTPIPAGPGFLLPRFP